MGGDFLPEELVGLGRRELIAVSPRRVLCVLQRFSRMEKTWGVDGNIFFCLSLIIWAQFATFP